MYKYIKMDKIRNKNIKKKIGVVLIEKKLLETRLT